MIILVCILLLSFQQMFSLEIADLNSPPVHIIYNDHLRPSLVNSVDFHPSSNKFCVTFTHNDRVVIYELDPEGIPKVFQTLSKAGSKLCKPQHALFSPDGHLIIVANWHNRTFTIYRESELGTYLQKPVSVISFPSDNSYRPHGMAYSPMDNYIAITFGASYNDPRAVALYEMIDEKRLILRDLIQTKEIDEGIPKGVAFSPDGTHILVTLSETNSVIVYPIDRDERKLITTAQQIIEGSETNLFRPEDIKLTADGDFIAVSNSAIDTITFYRYDREQNLIIDNAPALTMKNPEAMLTFPHGLAFSPDGQFLAVTQFGPVEFSEDGHLISWGTERQDSVALYALD